MKNGIRSRKINMTNINKLYECKNKKEFLLNDISMNENKTIVSPNNAFRSSKGSSRYTDEELEMALLFKEKPRQFLFLFIAITLISYHAFTHKSDNLSQNIKNAIISAIFVFLFYCFLQTRDGLLLRPHPGIWRIVHGVGVLYLMSLAALLVQNYDGARRTINLFFPDVQIINIKSGPTKMNKLNCDINFKSIYKAATSIWFVAHVCGWWGKMCLFRDWRFCWVLSIAFEFLELILQFIIPDFLECWWDSIFMDMLGANLLGMILGKITLVYFESKEYDWSGSNRNTQKEQIRSGFCNLSYLRRAINQLHPFKWSKYKWEVFSCQSRFLQVVFVLILCLIAELNAFFLLATFNIPKNSNIHKYRLIIIFLIGVPAAAEYYEFIHNKNYWRIGQNAWLMCSIICFEILVWVRFLPEISYEIRPVSVDIYIPIFIFLFLFSIWILLFFRVKSRINENKTREWILNLLFYASFMPLLYLIKQWEY